MSVTLRTRNYGELESCGFNGAFTGTVYVGDYEIPTEEFVEFAAYIMGGGLIGWGEAGIPEYVRENVKYIRKRLKKQKKRRSWNRS